MQRGDGGLELIIGSECEDEPIGACSYDGEVRILCGVGDCQGWGVCESRTDNAFFFSSLIIGSVNGEQG